MSKSDSTQQTLRDSEGQTYMYRRSAMRVGTVALISLVLLGWFGGDALSSILTWRMSLLLAGFAISLAALTLSVFTGTAVTTMISMPLRRLSEAAEAVASGQMDAHINGTRRKGEFGRLARAVHSMVQYLSRTVQTLGAASQETAALAAEITSGTDQMAASAQEMASTSSTLSQQSLKMSETIQQMAGDAARLAELSSHVTSGVRDGAARNSQLRALAAENRSRLNDSSRALQELAVDADSSATAVEALAASAEEIRAFVTLVQKMARQSKLLALNAAMEAARAGEQGQGFAVVASEVRRLAASSTEAAERAESLVAAVLERAAESRASSTRTVATVRGVLSTTEQGLVSFTQVEDAVRESESWAATVGESAARSDALVSEMTHRLEELANGTESFAAAMEQVAASAEQQSASTQQIAAAANTLDASARRLAGDATTRGEVSSKRMQESAPRRELQPAMQLATA